MRKARRKSKTDAFIDRYIMEVEFQQRESAEQVWYLLDECFRKGWKRLTFSESAGMTYSMYND